MAMPAQTCPVNTVAAGAMRQAAPNEKDTTIANACPRLLARKQSPGRSRASGSHPHGAHATHPRMADNTGIADNIFGKCQPLIRVVRFTLCKPTGSNASTERPFLSGHICRGNKQTIGVVVYDGTPAFFFADDERRAKKHQHSLHGFCFAVP